MFRGDKPCLHSGWPAPCVILVGSPGAALPVVPEIESVATNEGACGPGGRLREHGGWDSVTGDTNFRRKIQYLPGRDVSRQDSDAKRNMVISCLPGTRSF